MNLTTTQHFFQSATLKLTLTYLSIIMLMSITFSVVFYNTSSRQLGRQIPRSFTTSGGFGIRVDGGIIGGQRQEVEQFFQQRVDEGRHELLMRLFFLNLLALAGGSLLSYALARESLRPIEETMEAQNRFVSDASHELRTPLTALQTTNEVALRKPKLNIKEAKALLAKNVEETEKLKNLTDGLLGLLKNSNSFSPQTISLQDIVSEAMGQIVQKAQARQITVNDEVADTKVLGNKTSLVQVVAILLDNSIKYSHENGKILLTSSTKNKFAYLNVKDEGIGIKDEDLPHIFERFYRTDMSRSKITQEGYGLGLSIAHKIIEQHHGEISVESKLDKGTTFTVKLVLAD